MRTFPVLITNSLAGGNLWWMTAIKPNSADSWGYDYIVAGTLIEHDFGANISVRNRLLGISSIDTSIEILDSHLAKRNDVDVIWNNADFDLNPNNFLGQTMLIFVGAGTYMSMSDLRADKVFSGRVYEVKRSKFEIVMTCRGYAQQWYDRQIGEKMPSNAHSESVGKIKPIVYGLWTDDNAFIPSVISAPIGYNPKFIFDSKGWRNFHSLFVFDRRKELFRVAIGRQDWGWLNTARNTISFWERKTTLRDDYDVNASVMYLTNSASLHYEVKPLGSAEKASPCIIQIEGSEEQMLVLSIDNAQNRIVVDRGYNNTTKTAHSAGKPVYQANIHTSSIKLPVEHIFYPEEYSGRTIRDSKWVNLRYEAIHGVYRLKRLDKYDGVQPTQDYLLHYVILHSEANKIASIMFDEFDMIFPEVAAEGVVKGAYVIVKGRLSCERVNNPDGRKVIAILKLVRNHDYVEDYNPYRPLDIINTDGVIGIKWRNNLDNEGVDVKEDETAIVLPQNFIPNVENLNNTCFSIATFCRNDLTGQNITGVSEHELMLYRIGLRVDFSIPLDKFYFLYAKAETRNQPEGTSYYLNTPHWMFNYAGQILEALCRQEGALVNENLNQTFFNNFHSKRLHWSLAVCFHE